MLLISNYYSIHVVFILHRLAVLFAIEREDGNMYFELKTVCCYPRGGSTPLYGLYGDVPLDRVWFLASLP